MAKQLRVDGRTERSRRTRARVVDAAGRLFVENGYVATTVEDVSVAAGVAVQTVYYLFGNKVSLLGAVLDASIAGDLEPVPVLERAWVDALRHEADPAVAVRRLVAESAATVARVSSLYKALRQASADPDVGALLAENHRRRRVVHEAIVAILQQSGHLGAGVEFETAVDVYYSIVSEEVFELFTGQCGWSADRFREWATDLLLRELVTGASPASSGARR
jgi:AcrR family transcriptional regulator